MNKLIKYFVFFLLLTTSITSSLAQYITINGKQFLKGDTPFYPVVCNYFINYVSNESTPTDFYLSPLDNYDLNYFECDGTNSCIQQMGRHFVEIKSMGFNAIRIIGWVPNYTYLIEFGPCFRIKPGVIFNNTINSYTYALLLKPYESDINTQHVFNNIKNVLDAASVAGLKVILVTGHVLENPSVITSFNIDYNLYLDALSKYIVNNCTLEEQQALMAYDLINEPLYSNHSGWPYLILDHSKQDVCNKTTMWYNTLKSNDPNHLITLGGSYFRDIFEWDPSILKIDFYSSHLYSQKKVNYETTLSSQSCGTLTPLDQLEYRIFGDLYWSSVTCPMPFIIGETGFRSKVGTNGPDGPPGEQLSYAQITLQKSLDYGSSGYSWWEYQDYDWGGDSYFGLLLAPGFCNPPCYLFEKPVVQAFRDFDPNANQNIGDQPCNYFDPYNHYYYGPQSSRDNTIYGSVLDFNTNIPIKNAVIFGWTRININPQTNQWNWDYHYTFSDTLGNFQLIPYDYFNPPSPNTIEDMRISAPGADRTERGWNSNPIVNHDTYMLKQISFNYNEIFNNITVHSNENRILQAWDKLTSYGLHFEGLSNGEIKSRSEINILPGNQESSFDATSEVHIFNNQTFQDCDNFNNFANMPIAYLPVNDYKEESELITLFFRKNNYRMNFIIFPNPNSGIFTISINDICNTNKKYKIVICNLLGKTVYQTERNLDTFEINIKGYPMGIYTIQLISESDKQTKKLIIN